MENYYGGFGSRRKRNLTLINRDGGNTQIGNHGIQWGNTETENEVEQEYIQNAGMEKRTNFSIGTEENDIEQEQMNALLIGGKPFKPRVVSGKRKFSDTHIRFTTYLEKDLHNTIQVMNKQGYFDSITQFINDSVKAYLLEHFSE